MRLLLVIFFLTLWASPASSQKKTKKSGMDSVNVKGRSFLILGDSSIYVEKDTVFVLPDTLAAKIKLDRTERSKEFYQKLKEKFYRRKFTKELYDLLFVDPPKSGNTQPQKSAVSGRDYHQYKGKKIKQIVIKKLEVFGTSINDTTKHVDKWAINVGNSLHSYTKKGIIRNNIFFKEGDRVEPDLLTDSERVLRNLPYIKDARVYIISEPGSEEVEILILVKDIWSISPEIQYDKLDKFNVSLTDKNFLGLGQALRNEFLYNQEDTPKIGYSGTYTVNNIYRTFITGRLYFASSQPLDRFGVSFSRDFITPETKYAGGLTLLKERRELERVFPDTTYVFNAAYRIKDIWLGRSFLIDEAADGSRSNLEIAGRYSDINHSERPLVAIDTNQQFFDSHQYLFSIGLTKRAYERSSLIAGFGRTEDIPVGYLASFTAGQEVNEFYHRSYLGWRLAYGRFFDKLGYLRPALSFGGYLRGNKMEQGVFNIKVQYFSYLYRYRRTSFRQFFLLSYTLGINRFDNEYVHINDGNGVRGLSYTFLRGTCKLAFSAETVAFTSMYFLGFRFAPFLFVDLAVINDDYQSLLKNTLYQGYGIGVRLRNENLAFNTIQLRLGWYPVTPPTNSRFGFELTGQSTLGYDDFQTGIPTPVKFE